MGRIQAKVRIVRCRRAAILSAAEMLLLLATHLQVRKRPPKDNRIVRYVDMHQMRKR